MTDQCVGMPTYSLGSGDGNLSVCSPFVSVNIMYLCVKKISSFYLLFQFILIMASMETSLSIWREGKNKVLQTGQTCHLQLA
jgi:hypothetical protein